MATFSVHRFFSSSACYSTNFFILSRTPKMKVLSKIQWPYLNFKSFIASQMPYCRSDLKAATSPVSNKVVQGRPSGLNCGSPIQFHPLCFVNSADQSFSNTLRTDRAAKSTHMEEENGDSSLQTDILAPEFVELYMQLTRDLIETGNEDWMEQITSSQNGEKRLFTKAVISELPGKFFEYHFFFNKKEQRLKGVIQFGPYTQGPPGCVHGGASAAMMDAAIGVCVSKSFSHCVTASLSMNYKSVLPLGTIALVESKVDKVDGRKVFGSAELKSPDGKVTYVTADALFIKLDPEKKMEYASKM